MSSPYPTARAAKHALTQTFAEAGIPFAEDDALEIIFEVTGFDKSAMILRGNDLLSPENANKIEAYMTRRLLGEPVDHILGWREFYGRRFKISADVLSPRADTELLVRDALSKLSKGTPLHILDLGTGSGAIGLTLLAERPNVTLVATDLSPKALRIAETNAKILGVESRVTFKQGAWWQAVPDAMTFDLILSNPPYITNEVMGTLETEVRDYDPDLALRGGDDGLDAYRKIIEQAHIYLKPQGWLGFEIGYDQDAALAHLMTENAALNSIGGQKDLGGNDRTFWAQKQT